MITTLRNTSDGPARRSMMTSVPWPAEREDMPAVDGISSQAVPLFDPALQPRMRRFLLLAESEESLPGHLHISGVAKHPRTTHFSEVAVHTLCESLDPKSYVYQECEARLCTGNREIGLSLGLLPNQHAEDVSLEHVSRWQWVAAERIWSGPVAEAWRIGGHLVPYTTSAPGTWKKQNLGNLGSSLERYCGDVLHGDLFVIVWRNGLFQVTAHFKSGYLHAWPKSVPALPLVLIRGLRGAIDSGSILPGRMKLGDEDGIDFTPCARMFSDEYPGRLVAIDDCTAIQPWQDLRILANKTIDNDVLYMESAETHALPAGVSRSFWFHIGLNGVSTDVARYQVDPSWYALCGEIMTDRTGMAANAAGLSTQMIRDSTQQGGIDTGRVWRYLRRDLRTGIPEEDGPEWEGNLARAMFTFAYQQGEPPEQFWELYLHHAYHAADIGVYHGAWMGRLECSQVFSSPLPKFRFAGILNGYLETGDPYLLEIARSLAGVYMAMESALQPRSAMGRDVYPLTSLLTLWDYSAEPQYLEFSRKTAQRLLHTQQADGGFSGQAGAGVFTGISCKPSKNDIHFGSGVLAPIALVEWLRRDRQELTADVRVRLQKWADLMIRLQAKDGCWHSNGTPYWLTCFTAAFTLSSIGDLLNDPRCLLAVRRFLEQSVLHAWHISGTHSFLSPLYAHAIDQSMHQWQEKNKNALELTLNRTKPTLVKT